MTLQKMLWFKRNIQNQVTLPVLDLQFLTITSHTHLFKAKLRSPKNKITSFAYTQAVFLWSSTSI